MTGYVQTLDGETWRLPALTQWEILCTDGSSCDSALVVFPMEADRLQTLKACLYLRLEEDEKTVFYGVVDEVSARCDDTGSRVEVAARGLMALLMDSQLRQASFYTFQEADAVSRLVKPFGVDKVKLGNLPAVRNFSWSTGTSPWEALCGYCRHAGNTRPRFSADGTLLLHNPEPACWNLTDSSGLTEAEFRFRRYGVIGRQTVVTAGGVLETAENPGFTTQKVAMKTGDTLKSTWRTAEQRVEDSLEDAAVLTVTLPGDHQAQPGDTVLLSLRQFPGENRFTLSVVKKVCGRNGRRTILELKGEPG